MKRFLILVPALLIAHLVAAQYVVTDTLGLGRKLPGIYQRINPDEDSRLEQIVEWHIEKNQRINGLPGYRVEIFFSSDLNARERALKVKTDFLSLFPDVSAHVIYVSPDFKVRVGDFRTKNEALRLMKQVQGRFPKAFIVPDIINFPKLN